jgi:hypothetical protein
LQNVGARVLPTHKVSVEAFISGPECEYDIIIEYYRVECNIIE